MNVRAALTETRNVFPMPEDVGGLAALAGRMDDIRHANVEHHAALIREARVMGVRALCMGELFAAPYFALTRDPMWFALAEDASGGPTVTAMCSLARETGIVLIVPIYELEASTGKRFNTAVVIDETGTILGKYRKTHIPEGRNEQGGFHETFYYGRSEGVLPMPCASTHPYFPVFTTRVARIGIAICYDRHFPGVMQTLAREGAEIVFSPAVTFGEKSRAMWHEEFHVDALRQRLFIGGSNRKGRERPWNQEYFGESHFVGPDGRVPEVEAPPGLVVCDLPLDALTAEDGSGWNLPRDARPDIYG